MRLAILAMVLIVAGCGPLVGPMLQRLDPEDQRTLDSYWENILAHQPGLNREELLDVVVAYSLISTGVDSANYHAEKAVGDRLVVMDVIFDRARQGRDSFIISLFDKEGGVVRRESYAREDVDRAYALYRELSHAVATQPATQPEPAAETARRLKVEARRAVIQAATQPVRGR